MDILSLSSSDYGRPWRINQGVQRMPWGRCCICKGEAGNPCKFLLQLPKPEHLQWRPAPWPVLLKIEVNSTKLQIYWKFPNCNSNFVFPTAPLSPLSSKPLFSFRLATASQEEVVGEGSLSFSPEAQESSRGLSKDAKCMIGQGISVHKRQNFQKKSQILRVFFYVS